MTHLYQARIAKLLESEASRLYCLTAYDGLQGKRDDEMPFKQEANFEYLTGIKEPGWKLGIDPRTRTAWLCMPERSEIRKIFDGGVTQQEASAISGITDVVDSATHQARLATYAKTYGTIYTVLPDKNESYYDFVPNPALKNHTAHLSELFDTVADARQTIGAIRAIKTAEEIELMRGAIAVTIDAFETVKTSLQDKKHEYEIEAQFSYSFRNTGAGGHAYEPIVAASGNACTLHYNTNNDPLPKNGLVLIDAGAVIAGYAADITRTCQLGTATDRQQQVHKVVESAHYEIIGLIKPGLQFTKYQDAVDVIMKRACMELGLIENEDDAEGYRHYFPHAISHGLGLDVHESLGGFKAFQAGMVLTVEPGIYIPEEAIGVRIEDDILVTATGNENLSARLPTSL